MISVEFFVIHSIFGDASVNSILLAICSLASPISRALVPFVLLMALTDCGRF